MYLSSTPSSRDARDPVSGGSVGGFEQAPQPPEPVVDAGPQSTGRDAEFGSKIGIGTIAQDCLDHRIPVVGPDAGQGLSQLGTQDQQVDVVDAGGGRIFAG